MTTISREASDPTCMQNARVPGNYPIVIGMDRLASLIGNGGGAQNRKAGNQTLEVHQFCPFRRLRDPAKATAVAGPINEKMIEGLNGWSRQVPDQFAIGMPSRCCPACHRQAYQQLRHGNEQLPVIEDFDHRLGNRHTLFGGGRFACSSSDQHAVVARSDGLKVQSGDDLPGMFAARFLALGIEPWLRRH